MSDAPATDGWTEQADHERQFVFRVPNTTPKGQSVRIYRTERDEERRIHALTPDEHEVYFEVTWYSRPTELATLSENQRRHLTEQATEPRITADRQVNFGQRQAVEFEFSGALRTRHKVRRFIFIDDTAHTYRVVYDPTSPLNLRVLDTLTLPGGAVGKETG